MKRNERTYRIGIGWAILSILIFHFSLAQAEDTTAIEKPAIYQYTTIKLDIASPIMAVAMSKGQLQHYEIGANVRLQNRYYPTLELGYAGGVTNRGDSIFYNGNGVFFRVGADINPLKKHPESPHAMLVGIRISTAVQNKGETDCWGEIVAGCQVEVAQVNKTAFYMGWMGRFKILFTRNLETPIYIPGYGMRENLGWGVNYHLGWRF